MIISAAGKLALEDGKRQAARDEFDKAVDEVLLSGFDIRANSKLETFYLELVERIYREEVPVLSPPSANRPQIGFAEQKNSTSTAPQLAPSPSVSSPNTAREVQLPLKYGVGYSGDSPAEVYGALLTRRLELAKSTFETTAAFRERLNKLLATVKIGSRSLQDPLTFVISDFDRSYDADRETITLTLNLAARGKIVYEIPDELLKSFDRAASKSSDYSYFVDYGSVDLWWTSKTLGNRVGHNAFGVRIPYVIRQYTSLRLAMRGTNLETFGQKLTMHANPNIARNVLASIKVAFVGHVQFPFIHQEVSYENATISNHEESHYLHMYLFVEPEGLVVFNSTTGEILGVASLPLEEKQRVIELSAPKRN